MSEEEYKSYKPESSVDDVIELVGQQLRDDVTDINRTNDGEINAVYFARLQSGKEVVIRVSPKIRGYNNFGAEAWAFGKCRKLGVPTPQVLVVNTATKDFPEAYMVTERLPGKSGGRIELTDTQKGVLVKQIGHYLSLIHSVKTGGFGRFKREGTGYVGGDSSFEHFLQHELNTSWWARSFSQTGLVSSNELEELREYFRRHKGIFRLDEASLVHGDLSSSLRNVNIEDETITGIFDMENARAHDSVFDFAWFDFWDLEEGRFIDALKEGYDNKEIFDQNFQTKLRFYQLLIGYSLMPYYNNRGREDDVVNMRGKIEILRNKIDLE